jgi:hypothetical protein
MNLVINIDVDDLEKGIAFYQSAFGLRLGRRLFGGTVAEMVGVSSNVYLLSKPSGAPPRLRFRCHAIIAATGRRCIWTLRSKILNLRSNARWRPVPNLKATFKRSLGVTLLK